MKEFLLYLSLTMLFVFGLNCDDDNPFDPNPSVIEYSKHIQPILVEYEGLLKANNIFPQGLDLSSWQALIQGWQRGEVVIPFDAARSLLLELTTKLQNDSELSQEKLALLARWIDEGAQNDAGEVPYENSTNVLYVCNQDAASISIIDTDAKLVIRTVDLLALGYPITSKPHHIAVEPDGSAWYVSLIGESKVLKFDRNNKFVAETPIEVPALLAAHPDNGLLYVSRFPQAAGQTPQLVGVIERASMTALDDIPVRPNPHAMAVDHAGAYVYTCSLSESELVVINAATNELVEILDLGASKGPLQVAVSPDDQTVFVSNQISNEMFAVDVSDPSSRQIVTAIPVNSQPWHPVYTPDGSRVYVGNLGSNTVTALNTASNQALATIGDGTGADGLSQPHGIAATADGKFVFVSCRNADGRYIPAYDFGDNDVIGTVIVINTTNNTIEKIIEIEEFGSGMAIHQE